MYGARTKSTFLRFIRLCYDRHFDMWPNCMYIVCFIHCKCWDLPSSINNQRQEGLIFSSDHLVFFLFSDFCTDKSCIQSSSFMSDIHLHIYLVQNSESICICCYTFLWKLHIFLFNMCSNKHLTDNTVTVSCGGNNIKPVKCCSSGTACLWSVALLIHV
jgi:hypothetical protein